MTASDRAIRGSRHAGWVVYGECLLNGFWRKTAGCM